mgnify:CR=1 FL=1
MTAGDAFQFTAASRRNGAEVENTEEHPIGYVWCSSDTNVATVDSKGVVTAVGEGTCQITAVLDQNRTLRRDLRRDGGGIGGKNTGGTVFE